MGAYSEFVKRNAGYIPSDVQEKIRDTRVLIAGCLRLSIMSNISNVERMRCSPN